MLDGNREENALDEFFKALRDDRSRKTKGYSISLETQIPKSRWRRMYVTTLPLPINQQIGSVPWVTKVSLNP